MPGISDQVKTGLGAGVAVFVVLAIAVFISQSGMIGGTALGLLVLSPVPIFVSGAVAGRQTVSAASDNNRAAVRVGVTTGTLTGVLPAVLAARFGYGLAAIGDNVLGVGGVLVTGLVLGILCLSGLLGGIGAWLHTLLITEQNES